MEGSQQTTSDKHCPNKILKLRSLTYRNNNIISMDKCHPNGWQKFKRTMYIHQPTTELHSRNYILKTDKTILAALSLRYNIVPMHKHYSWSTLELHYTILCTSKDLFASQTKITVLLGIQISLHICSNHKEDRHNIKSRVYSH